MPRFPAALEFLPAELLLDISDHLSTSTLSRLLRVNTYLNCVLTPSLYLRSKSHSLLIQSLTLDRLSSRPNTRPPFGTPLHYAASTGNTSAVHKLLDANFPVDLPCAGRGLSPLTYAAAHGHAGAAELLLSRGAHSGASSEETRTPLFLVISYCHSELFLSLLPHLCGRIPGTAMHCACQDNRRQNPVVVPSAAVHNSTEVRVWMMLELLKYGCSVDERNSHQQTPLHITCQHPLSRKSTAGNVYSPPDSVTIVEFLLANGADVNAVDSHGVTPLHYAIQGGRVDIARVLMAAGAAVDMQDGRGQTPLHYVWSGSREAAAECAELLLAAGADLEVKDAESKTVMDSLHGYYEYASWPSVKELYLQRGGTLLAPEVESDDYFWDYETCFGVLKVLLRYGASAEAVRLKDMRITLDLWEEYGRKLIEGE